MARVDVKVCLLGSSGVGKTCLLERFVSDQFEPNPKNTIGAAFAAKKVRVKDGNTITLGIWDTAGAEKFESLSRMYYHGSRAAVVCFDASQKATFAKAQFWVNELQQQQPGCNIHIVVTKSDLLAQPNGQGQVTNGGGIRRRDVPEADIQKFAESVQATVWMTSAKSGQGVQELFQGIAEALAASMAETPRPANLPLINARPSHPGSPRSHRIILSPGQSPPSRADSLRAPQSTCC